MNKSRLLLAVALLAIVSTSNAQELRDVAQWCYAASDILAKEAGSISEYGVLRDHLGSVIQKIYNIDPTEAKINGVSAIKESATYNRVTMEKTSLTFYKEVCKPVFVQ